MHFQPDICLLMTTAPSAADPGPVEIHDMTFQCVDVFSSFIEDDELWYLPNNKALFQKDFLLISSEEQDSVLNSFKSPTERAPHDHTQTG